LKIEQFIHPGSPPVFNAPQGVTPSEFRQRCLVQATALRYTQETMMIS